MIAKEIERIELALREPQTDERYCALYGAQQALRWAIDQVGFKSPYLTIQLGLVRPPIHTPEEPVSYPACSDPHLSGDIHARMDLAR